MPATMMPDLQVQWARPPSSWRERVEFMLWQPAQATQARAHEVTPDANVDLLIELSESDCRAWLYGPVTRTARFRTREGCDYCVVHFLPGAMPRLVDACPAELVDTAVELRSVGGVSVDGLGEQLVRARSMEQRWQLMGGVLRSATWPELDTFDRAWRYLQAQEDMPSVAQLSEALHLSSRTLERAFQERLGFSPRTFRRIHRLQQALAKLRSESARSLTEIALASGYADHAHLTREVRALTGRTPTEFREHG
ncbi:AraC family transcriptional regulator [Hyalangium versicolor]|uniref:AraC family transcriptional regulator n=1 Tax=Hyalangium versicolor TaxID=2861190 RepID=UPI001CCB6E95|nr:helix-turn-helix domain-containing protein [Hyalangium versicolor]